MDSLIVAIIVIMAFACAACILRIRNLTSEIGRLRRDSMMKSAFMRNLNNEIRTPPLSINRQADVISQEDIFLSKDEKHTIAGQMRYNVSLISTLLDELSACIGNGQGHNISKERFSPTMMCRQCITSNLNNTYLSPDVKLRFRREMDDATFICSDMHIVELILNKLVINACKFTKQGEILIGCNTTENPDCLTIYVQDTGVGMPEDRTDKIFDWFENPDEAGAEVEFDLSVAQKMAVRLGGTLRFDDRYRQGTRMTLLLPMKHTGAAAII